MNTGPIKCRSLEEIVIPKLAKHVARATKHRPHILYTESGQLKLTGEPNAFTLASLADSLTLIERAQREFGNRIKVLLGIWVDDFGQACSGQICKVNQPQVLFSNLFSDLPHEIRTMIAEKKFMSEHKVLITAERRAKNRALRRMRDNVKNTHPNLVLEPSNHQGSRRIISYDGDQDDHVPVAFINGEHWTVKCAAIVEQHYRDIADILHKRFPHSDAVTITDQSEMHDRMKVTWGSEMVMRQGTTTDASPTPKQVINVFYEGPLGQIKLVNQVESDDFRTAA